MPPPLCSVKINHKKDGRLWWPHRFHVSRPSPPPPPFPGRWIRYCIQCFHFCSKFCNGGSTQTIFERPPPSSVLGLVPSLRNPGSSLICQLELMNTTKRYNFSKYNGKKIYLQKNPCDYRLGLSIAF